MKMKDNKVKNKKKKTRKNLNEFSLKEVIFITLAFMILSMSLTYVFTVRFGIGGITNKYLNSVIKSYNKLTNYYYEDVNEEELSSAAIDGMMNYLDENYTSYLNNNDTLTLTQKLEGEYKGIGITMYTLEDYCLVAEVLDDSPAEAAGLLSGDKILKFGDTKVDKNFNQSEFKKELEQLKSIVLTVERDGKTLELKVTVKNVEVPVTMSTVYEKNDKKIGYIYLSTFNEYSYKQFKKDLEKMEKEGIDSLIIDVRSNTGGYLEQCTEILELFVKKDKVLHQLIYKNKKSVTLSKGKSNRSYPIVVLINQHSASASEVLAAAMKESYGATLIGMNSFGKGKVQQMTSLTGDTMIKYTVANWLTPNGNSIDGIGLKPGFEVELTQEYAEDPSDENDLQLQKALEFLNNR